MKGAPHLALCARIHPLAGNAAWSIGGNAFYALCQWGMLVVLARAGNPRLVGEFAFGLALTAPVFLFTNLQARAIQSTDVSGEFSFGDYLGLRLATTAAGLLALCAVMLAGDFSADMRRVVLVVSLAKAIEALSDVFHGDLQRRERMRSVAKYLSLKGALTLVVMAIAVKVFGSAFAAGLAWAAVFALVLVFGEIRFALAPVQPVWNPPVLRRLITLALPLGAVMALISLNANMPRYFVQQRLGAESLGVFAALSYLTLAGSTVINAVGLSVTPRLARLYIEARADFVRMLLWMSALATVPAIAGMAVLALAGRPILTVLYGAPYAAHLNVAVWLMAAGGISYAASVVGYGLTAAHCFRPQLPLFAVVTVVAAAASYILIRRNGLAGAVAGQIIAALVQLAGGAGLLMYTIRRSPAGAPSMAEAAA